MGDQELQKAFQQYSRGNEVNAEDLYALFESFPPELAGNFQNSSALRQHDPNQTMNYNGFRQLLENACLETGENQQQINKIIVNNINNLQLRAGHRQSNSNQPYGNQGIQNLGGQAYQKSFQKYAHGSQVTHENLAVLLESLPPEMSRKLENSRAMREQRLNENMDFNQFRQLVDRACQESGQNQRQVVSQMVNNINNLQLRAGPGNRQSNLQKQNLQEGSNPDLQRTFQQYAQGNHVTHENLAVLFESLPPEMSRKLENSRAMRDQNINQEMDFHQFRHLIDRACQDSGQNQRQVVSQIVNNVHNLQLIAGPGSRQKQNLSEGSNQDYQKTFQQYARGNHVTQENLAVLFESLPPDMARKLEGSRAMRERKPNQDMDFNQFRQLVDKASQESGQSQKQVMNQIVHNINNLQLRAGPGNKLQYLENQHDPQSIQEYQRTFHQYARGNYVTQENLAPLMESLPPRMSRQLENSRAMRDQKPHQNMDFNQFRQLIDKASYETGQNQRQVTNQIVHNINNLQLIAGPGNKQQYLEDIQGHQRQNLSDGIGNQSSQDYQRTFQQYARGNRVNQENLSVLFNSLPPEMARNLQGSRAMKELKANQDMDFNQFRQLVDRACQESGQNQRQVVSQMVNNINNLQLRADQGNRQQGTHQHASYSVDDQQFQRAFQQYANGNQLNHGNLAVLLDSLPPSMSKRLQNSRPMREAKPDHKMDFNQFKQLVDRACQESGQNQRQAVSQMVNNINNLQLRAGPGAVGRLQQQQSRPDQRK